MDTYRTEAVVKADGSIDVSGLPFAPGVRVEVIVRDAADDEQATRYPLRGQPLQYDDPFGSIGEEDWKAAQ